LAVLRTAATRFWNRSLAREVMCLKETKEGYPIHPLYVAADTEPTKYESRL